MKEAAAIFKKDFIFLNLEFQNQDELFSFVEKLLKEKGYVKEEAVYLLLKI
jgi:mannitol/fructose-specific phosphotransferase system IIA component (Ntr-type)